MEKKTKTSGIKPPTNNNAVGMAFGDDHIKELGDRIAKLSRHEQKELKQYIREKYRIQI